MPGDRAPNPSPETRTAHPPPPAGTVHAAGSPPPVDPDPADPHATRIKPGDTTGAVAEELGVCEDSVRQYLRAAS